MSDDQYDRSVLGVLERLREALKPLANLVGLQVRDDSDGCSCCAGLIVTDPTRSGDVRLYFSSRGSEGKYTRLTTGWKATVDIDEGEYVRDTVEAPVNEMTSPAAVVGFFLEQLPRSLALLTDPSSKDSLAAAAARLQRQREAFDELDKL